MWFWYYFTVLEYSVEVYTKDESGAGTDSNVYLEICGKRGDTGKRKLQSSETEGNKFESGKVCLIFKIYLVY